MGRKEQRKKKARKNRIIFTVIAIALPVAAILCILFLIDFTPSESGEEPVLSGIYVGSHFGIDAQLEFLEDNITWSLTLLSDTESRNGTFTITQNEIECLWSNGDVEVFIYDMDTDTITAGDSVFSKKN